MDRQFLFIIVSKWLFVNAFPLLLSCLLLAYRRTTHTICKILLQQYQHIDQPKTLLCKTLSQLLQRAPVLGYHGSLPSRKSLNKPHANQQNELHSHLSITNCSDIATPLRKNCVGRDVMPVTKVRSLAVALQYQLWNPRNAWRGTSLHDPKGLEMGFSLRMGQPSTEVCQHDDIFVTGLSVLLPL